MVKLISATNHSISVKMPKKKTSLSALLNSSSSMTVSRLSLKALFLTRVKQMPPVGLVSDIILSKKSEILSYNYTKEKKREIGEEIG